jgi:hypothetical protein
MMAKDIKLDDYGDFVLDTGDFELVEEEEEVVQICKTKVLKLYDEDHYAREDGVNWFDDSNEKMIAMFDFGRDDRFKILTIKGRILSVPEVTGIPNISTSVPQDSDGEFACDMQIDTIYSDHPVEVNK